MQNLIKIIALSILFFYTASIKAQSPITPFESSQGKKTATYQQVADFYKQLDEQYDEITSYEVGSTDAQYPLQVVYYSKDATFNIEKWHKKGKTILLINNGIHPGEPDGIDASMMLLRDAASGKIDIPDNVVLAVIPIFNIGGMLNRNNYSRANQNGPGSYGFRGNSQNLDLNRDFMKMDAKETQSLVRFFHELDPDIFIDNHVSDGADYQHVMTLLSTQYNKLGGEMGKYLNEILEPAIYKNMKIKGYDLVPYVNHFGNTPEQGWAAFYEPPRFASGFAALFQTYSFVPETHMLKPFKQRVTATYDLELTFIKLASENAEAIRITRAHDRGNLIKQNEFPLEWACDTTVHSSILFKGYEAGYKPSLVSGQKRLFYDHSKPFERQVGFNNKYIPKQTVQAPRAYIIRHGWDKLIKRLKLNGVKMTQIERDTLMALNVYYIKDYETGKKPYEGHYLHANIKVSKEQKELKILKGDYIVNTNQPAKRYIVEALEPTAPDGFFAWGFVDGMLQQKEYFSDYVFEDEAAELIKKDSVLRDLLAEKQKSDTVFAKDGAAQLDFIYRHSFYYEPTHNLYPVFRLE